MPFRLGPYQRLPAPRLREFARQALERSRPRRLRPGHGPRRFEETVLEELEALGRRLQVPW